MLKGVKFYVHEKITRYKKKDFLFAFKSKLFISADYLSLRVVKENNVNYFNTTRVGFVVSRKVGNAVIRNKVKRRFRVIAKNIVIQNAKHGYYYIFIGNKSSIKTNFQSLKDNLIFCLNKLGMYT